MRYLTSYGRIWRVTERNYKRFLKDVADGKLWDLDDYGKPIGDAISVTDIDCEQAEDMLKTYEMFRGRI